MSLPSSSSASMNESEEPYAGFEAASNTINGSFADKYVDSVALAFVLHKRNETEIDFNYLSLSN